MSEDATITAYISLGSNCEQASRMLARAAQRVAGLAGVRVAAASPVYETEPQEDANQPWFLNQVLKLALAASWRPGAFVAALLAVEAAMGRVRDPGRRFGPRVIDLDLLLFGEERLAEADCTVPHPRLTQRAFVLVPLLDVAPNLSLDGVPLAAALQKLPFRLCGKQVFQ